MMRASTQAALPSFLPATPPGPGAASGPSVSARRLVGVLGGMGPAATIDLLAKIVAATPAAVDQEHVPLLVHAVPQIPDRTAAILAGSDAPFGPLLAGARALERGGAAVIAIACNAAHAWHAPLAAALAVRLLHIADEAGAALAALSPPPRCVALLSVRGTLHARVYQDRLAAWAGRLLLPGEDEQQRADAAIAAVKAGRPEAARGHALALARSLRRRGADALLLACTELPIAFAGVAAGLRLVDPTQALARACVAHSLQAGRDGAPCQGRTRP